MSAVIDTATIIGILVGLVALGLTLKAVAVVLHYIGWRYMTRPW